MSLYAWPINTAEPSKSSILSAAMHRGWLSSEGAHESDAAELPAWAISQSMPIRQELVRYWGQQLKGSLSRTDCLFESGRQK